MTKCTLKTKVKGEFLAEIEEIKSDFKNTLPEKDPATVKAIDLSAEEKAKLIYAWEVEEENINEGQALEFIKSLKPAAINEVVQANLELMNIDIESGAFDASTITSCETSVHSKNGLLTSLEFDCALESEYHETLSEICYETSFFTITIS